MAAWFATALALGCATGAAAVGAAVGNDQTQRVEQHQAAASQMQLRALQQQHNQTLLKLQEMKQTRDELRAEAARLQRDLEMVNAQMDDVRVGSSEEKELLLRQVEDSLNLTPEPRQRINSLEVDVQARLEKLLTADQIKILRDSRPRGGPPRSDAPPADNLRTGAASNAVQIAEELLRRGIIR